MYAWTVIVKFAEDLLVEEKQPLENKTIEVSGVCSCQWYSARCGVIIGCMLVLAVY